MRLGLDCDLSSVIYESFQPWKIFLVTAILKKRIHIKAYRGQSARSEQKQIV
jgi:hypothetical protein